MLHVSRPLRGFLKTYVNPRFIGHVMFLYIVFSYLRRHWHSTSPRFGVCIAQELSVLMAGKLSQPGCHANTGTKSGRALVKLEFLLPENNLHRMRGTGKLDSIPAMRGSIRKGEKKMKKGKKLLGRKSSFVQFDSKPVKCSFQTERDGVKFALLRFKKMWAAMASSRQSSPLQVLAKFKEQYPHLLVNKLHNREGTVPGIEVGDRFACRAELCLVGLHRPPQAGIDWKDIRHGSNIVSIALSIVVSGGYEDDVDEGETLTYTGEGGKGLNGSKRQCEDQVWEGGNVALRNSCFLRNSVRVIRGRVDPNSPSRMLYSYDGFYRVLNCERGPGISHFLVCRFKLVREAGQKPLAWQFPVSSPRTVLRGLQSPRY